MNKSFTELPMEHGRIYQSEDLDVYGMKVCSVTKPIVGTFFVYVQRGCLWVESKAYLYQGQFVCTTKHLLMSEDGCEAIVFHAKKYKGLFQIGGPIEQTGRLRYIDGCTDTLLVPPVKKGDPCLNHLHLPPRVVQSMHTHPSDRVGLVTRGAGRCHTPQGIIELRAGMPFIIHAGQVHGFETTTSSMDVIAYHPDSEFGATDEFHQMKVATQLVS